MAKRTAAPELRRITEAVVDELSERTRVLPEWDDLTVTDFFGPDGRFDSAMVYAYLENGVRPAHKPAPRPPAVRVSLRVENGLISVGLVTGARQDGGGVLHPITKALHRFPDPTTPTGLDDAGLWELDDGVFVPYVAPKIGGEAGYYLPAINVTNGQRRDLSNDEFQAVLSRMAAKPKRSRKRKSEAKPAANPVVVEGEKAGAFPIGKAPADETEPDIAEINRASVEALNRINERATATRRLDWADWMIVGRSVAAAHKVALARSNTGQVNPVVFSTLLADAGLARMDKNDRHTLRSIMREIDEVTAWRNGLTDAEREKMHSPRKTWPAYRAWKDKRNAADRGEPIIPAQRRGLSRDAAINRLVVVTNQREQARAREQIMSEALASLFAAAHQNGWSMPISEENIRARIEASEQDSPMLSAEDVAVEAAA